VHPGNQNIIILTSGFTGSSALAGFLAKSGYWAGETTYKKEYDTFENDRLIVLNRRLFQEIGYEGDHTTESSPDVRADIAALYGRIDDAPYRQFIAECNRHRPWVWKDPRLWLTFPYWQNLLDLNDCRFLVLTRNLNQGWLSTNLRGHIIGYRAFKKQETLIRDSNVALLESKRQPHLHVTYDSLITNPDVSIARIGAFLKAELSVESLKATYHKPLYQAPRASAFNSIKAVLKYLKHYSRRVEAQRSSRRSLDGQRVSQKFGTQK